MHSPEQMDEEAMRELLRGPIERGEGGRATNVGPIEAGRRAYGEREDRGPIELGLCSVIQEAQAAAEKTIED